MSRDQELNYQNALTHLIQSFSKRKADIRKAVSHYYQVCDEYTQHKSEEREGGKK